jgi:hypothetical protein
MMNDASKIKRKIMLLKDSNFNYSGFLIGPKEIVENSCNKKQDAGY